MNGVRRRITLLTNLKFGNTFLKRSDTNALLALLGGQVTRVALQGAYFVCLARLLGVSSYGVFAAIIALAALVTPFSSLGTNIIMIKTISRDHAAASGQWRRASRFTFVGGFAFSILIAALTGWVVPGGGATVLIVFIISVAELVCFKAIETSALAWQSLGRPRALIVLPAAGNFLRLVACVLFLTMGGALSLLSWSIANLCCVAPLCLTTTVITGRKLRKIHGGSLPKTSWSELWEGIQYSIGLSAQTVYNDIDKAMLATIASPSSAGVYSAAFRIIDMAYAPIRAVATYTYPLMFRDGALGPAGALRVAARMRSTIIALAITCCLATIALSPIAPVVLGSEFEGAQILVCLLAPVILSRTAIFVSADVLSCTGHQLFRTIAQSLVALLNIWGNLLVIPRWGSLGAVVTTLTCEALLATLLWIQVFRLIRRERATVPLGDPHLDQTASPIKG